MSELEIEKRPPGRPPKIPHLDNEMPIQPDEPIEFAPPAHKPIVQPEPIFPMQNKTSPPVFPEETNSAVKINGDWIDYTLTTPNGAIEESWNFKRVVKFEKNQNAIKDQVVITFDTGEKQRIFISIAEFRKLLRDKK